MDFTTPQSRNEAILQNILGADNVLVEPQSRVEAILQAILNNEPYTEPAMSRIEELLLAIKDGGSWDKETISRNEAILKAKLDGEEYTEDPQSRIEELLIEWCNQTPAGMLKEVSGALISVTDALARAAEDLTVQITATQNGSGDPAPDNVRPISGWTGANITRRGKNIWSEGDPSYTGTKQYLFTTPLMKAGVTYTISALLSIDNPSYTKANIFFGGTASGYIGVWYFDEGNTSRTVTPSIDVYKLNFYSTDSGATNPGVTATWDDFQIEVGSPATAYEAYNGNAYSITWQDEAGTIYGGSLDMTTGILTANYALVDMGDLSWYFVQPTASITYGTFYANANLDGAVKIKGVSNIISDIYKHATAWSEDKSCKGNAANYVVYVVDSSFNGDVQAFTEAVSGHHFCYEVDPTEYQLTPTQIQMLVGVNNIWADCGSSTLKYWGSEPVLLGGGLGGTLGLSLNPENLDAMDQEVETEAE